MSEPQTTFGVYDPDEREVTVLRWSGIGDYLECDLAEEGRKLVLVGFDVFATFEAAATRQGWVIEKIGGDDGLRRYVYRIVSMPEKVLKATNMLSTRDQAMIRARALTNRNGKRWPVTEAARAEAVRGTCKARKIAETLLDGEEPLKAIDAHTSAVKTLAMMEGQNQSDEHEQEKYERIDGGKGTEAMKILVLRPEDDEKI